MLFPVDERDETASILIKRCGNDLPFLEELNEYELERLRRVTESANLDWRDLLMAVGSGEDGDAHREWIPDST